jgi:hypothetical protein
LVVMLDIGSWSACTVEWCQNRIVWDQGTRNVAKLQLLLTELLVLISIQQFGLDWIFWNRFSGGIWLCKISPNISRTLSVLANDRQTKFCCSGNRCLEAIVEVHHLKKPITIMSFVLNKQRAWGCIINSKMAHIINSYQTRLWLKFCFAKVNKTI